MKKFVYVYEAAIYTLFSKAVASIEKLSSVIALYFTIYITSFTSFTVRGTSGR